METPVNNPRFSRRDFLRTTAAAGAVLAFPAIAQQGYPNRPIRLICPWPAGGSTDAVM
ncbi:MAG: twin-arginine translocation signal domain-containing protein, partial [Lacisediminimonas sp.]|nr:twin-arginine translocation signal domain-containing protein [Lacisediminimonas sp.]